MNAQLTPNHCLPKVRKRQVLSIQSDLHAANKITDENVKLVKLISEKIDTLVDTLHQFQYSNDMSNNSVLFANKHVRGTLNH